MELLREMVACAQRAFYIKLGQQGRWATQCFLERTLRLGYEGTPWTPPESPNWDAVMEHWQTVLNTSHAVATNHTRQIRSFFEADGTCIFITIANNQLYWCLPDGDVELLEDRTHQRRTIDGWHHCSVGGTELTLDRIAGHLQALGGYRGTICAVNDFPYLQRKLLDERLPELDNARQAEQKLLESMRPLIQRLSWREFELLIDLLFSTSGWRRLGATGGLQETVDLELILPTTGERAFVQIKSKASPETFNDYRNRLKQTSIYTRMFFVWHTGDVGKVGVDEKIILIGPSRLPQMILDAGLYTWLYGKVC